MSSAPRPHLRPVVDDEPADERTPEQVAREAALREVDETILNIEAAIKRAERARKAVAAAGREPDVELALRQVVQRLEQARTTLFQETFFGGDQQRLV